MAVNAGEFLFEMKKRIEETEMKSYRRMLRIKRMELVSSEEDLRKKETKCDLC